VPLACTLRFRGVGHGLESLWCLVCSRDKACVTVATHLPLRAAADRASVLPITDCLDLPTKQALQHSHDSDQEAKTFRHSQHQLQEEISLNSLDTATDY
jgi:hypothetical protein